MSLFEEQIKQYSKESLKVVESSSQEINTFKNQCSTYIQETVDAIKNKILSQSKSGSVHYIENIKYSAFTDKKIIKKIKPHYSAAFTLYYKINIHDSICEYKNLSYQDDGYTDYVMGFEVNSCEIIEYIIEQIVKTLEKDNIYIVKGVNINKYSFSSYKREDEFKSVKKAFLDAKKTGTSIGLHRVTMSFAYFL